MGCCTGRCTLIFLCTLQLVSELRSSAPANFPAHPSARQCGSLLLPLPGIPCRDGDTTSPGQAAERGALNLLGSSLGELLLFFLLYMNFQPRGPPSQPCKPPSPAPFFFLLGFLHDCIERLILGGFHDWIDDL